MEIEKVVRPNILALKGYSSARDEFSGNTKATLLDANESPFDTDVNRYPDPYQKEVKKGIAKLKNVSVNQIFLGNGSDEAIDLIFRIFCEPGCDNVVITDPTYGMYEVSAGINNVEVIKASLNTDFTLNPETVLRKINTSTKVIFICSPNNPSGNLLKEEAILELVDTFEGIVVVDEAYIDFALSRSFTEKLPQFENLIVLQTFSKAWGLAGVRLGMAFANDKIIKLFNKVKPPYNINTLTQNYVMTQLRAADAVVKNIDLLIKERETLKAALASLSVVKHIFPSDSNFLLVRLQNAARVFTFLRDKNIIVRDRSKVKFGEDCLRITVGTPEENQTLINAIREL